MTSSQTPDWAAQCRTVLLSRSQISCVARELWSCSGGTYPAYRECIVARKQQAAAATAAALREASSFGGRDGGLQSLPATVKYSFEGVKHVLAEASAAVTSLSFASLRNDLLAYGCADGELWLVGLPASAHTQPTCAKARRMHVQAVVSLDWAYDNSQLLSVGHDGSLCVWEVAPTEGALTCIRSISVHTTAFLCGRFHRVNPSLAMIGTSSGTLEVYNCSTGMVHSRYQVSASGTGLQVTALDSSNHHVFLGDSSGTLHMYACEMHERQLSRLRPAGRLRLAAPGGGAASAPVTALQYVPFCRATDTPVLMAALQDGSLCIVRANEPSICPLSVINDVPLITYGSDDTSVYIVDVTARSFSTGGPRGGAGSAAAGAASGPSSSSDGGRVELR
ncbi:hypothetical protein GPECTOR_50g648 [Gonium pectorale]|uniref:Uncharacterized protein n=1 Tax=Gonium pectorale TaxID=33097 RepID=A0A150G7N8_GONPE|nr:hypothetical protein GPECTOR_50g648 [Gonium pectorale]|eukprot:KXZ45854.1 hypothetical protein GPECTOR_50g648 [Gonium pectorale]